MKKRIEVPIGKNSVALKGERVPVYCVYCHGFVLLPHNSHPIEDVDYIYF